MILVRRMRWWTMMGMMLVPCIFFDGEGKEDERG
jgi:hypothetical protein